MLVNDLQIRKTTLLLAALAAGAVAVLAVLALSGSPVFELRNSLGLGARQANLIIQAAYASAGIYGLILALPGGLAGLLSFFSLRLARRILYSQGRAAAFRF